MSQTGSLVVVKVNHTRCTVLNVDAFTMNRADIKSLWIINDCAIN